MNGELSMAHLIAQASVLVQIVMAMLVLASVVSWAVIISKRSLLMRTRRASDRFEERFWSGGNLSDLYESSRQGDEKEGIVPIFSAGYEEYRRQKQGGRVDADDAIAAVQRQMRVTQVREIERLEGGLALLATIGSTSPYVGLFGTVWGIMNSFMALANVKQATLSVVAPGIAEALIATAIGLFAAIPAVMAYNRFSAQSDALLTENEMFAEEFSSVLHRQAHGREA